MLHVSSQNMSRVAHQLRRNHSKSGCIRPVSTTRFAPCNGGPRGRDCMGTDKRQDMPRCSGELSRFAPLEFHGLSVWRSAELGIPTGAIGWLTLCGKVP